MNGSSPDERRVSFESYLRPAERASHMEGSDLFFAVVSGLLFLLILIGILVSVL